MCADCFFYKALEAKPLSNAFRKILHERRKQKQIPQCCLFRADRTRLGEISVVIFQKFI